MVIYFDRHRAFAELGLSNQDDTAKSPRSGPLD
jgi:hypothetical protein